MFILQISFDSGMYLSYNFFHPNQYNHFASLASSVFRPYFDFESTILNFYPNYLNFQDPDIPLKYFFLLYIFAVFLSMEFKSINSKTCRILFIE